jgi:hypothetical protein
MVGRSQAPHADIENSSQNRRHNSQMQDVRLLHGSAMHEMFAPNVMHQRRPPFFLHIAFFEKLAIADPIATPGATRNARTCSEFFWIFFGFFLDFFWIFFGFFSDFFCGGDGPGGVHVCHCQAGS